MIPIVFMVAEDPVRLGLVASLARPGGNLTGVNFFAVELAAKRLELLRKLVPAAARIAVLVNPAEATNTATNLRDVEAAARAMGLQIQVAQRQHQTRNRCGLRDFRARATRCAVHWHRSLFTSRRVQLAHLAARHAVPAIMASREFAEAGGPDELRSQPCGRVASDRRIYRPYSQGREACRPAGACSRPSLNSSSTLRPPGCSASPCPQSLLSLADEVIE